MKMRLADWITALIVIMAVAGGSCLLSFYNKPGTANSVKIAGYCLHFISLGLAFLMTTYLGRYYSGLQNDRNGEFVDDKHLRSDYYYGDSGNGCCGKYAYNFMILYCLVFIYGVFLIALFGCIASSVSWPNSMANLNPVLVNGLSEGIIIYFVSLMALWYSIVVFKPLIPNLCYIVRTDSANLMLPMDEKRTNEKNSSNCCISLFTRYGFYEDNADSQKYGIWSSVSLMIAFCISVPVMNCGFAVYYNSKVYHDVIISLGVAFTIIPLVLGGIIMIYANQRGDDVSCQFWSWTTIVLIWLVASFVTVWFYLPYGGNWPTDSAFVATTMTRNIFFIVQAVPACIGIIIGVVYLLFLFGQFLGWLCCKRVADEVIDAQRKIDSTKITDAKGKTIIQVEELNVL